MEKNREKFKKRQKDQENALKKRSKMEREFQGLLKKAKRDEAQQPNVPSESSSDSSSPDDEEDEV